MPTLVDALRERSVPVPDWLLNFRTGDSFPRADFFRSRIVFYPGSGTDGHPVKLFGSSHSAHCFIYADYGCTRDHLVHELEDAARGFSGYHFLERVTLGEMDLRSDSWIPHILSEEFSAHHFAAVRTNPFGFVEILERDRALDDKHGPTRLAIIFLGADGIAAYDTLFCQGDGTPAPFALIVQDHGSGGGYARFDDQSLLFRVAERCNSWPEYLLVAKNSKAWRGYDRVEADGEPGGMHGHVRQLYRGKNLGGGHQW
ncbi:hypothetical protein [Mesorhizobium sp. IMUNJ 23232]|uniref:hypothetical protein n=1 Tax=Mesorhizobium sp. IMUNJ 23232 TaxID=3376064 RepID=UPI0037889EC9